MREKCEFCNERVPKNKLALHLKNCIRARRAKKLEQQKEVPKTAKPKSQTSQKKKAKKKTTEVLESPVSITAPRQEISEQQSSADQVTKST